MEDQTTDVTTSTQGDASQTPQTFTISGKSYSQNDLEQLVGLGEKTREVETKYNTRMDRVFPEYTKATQEMKRIQAENAEYRKRLDDFSRKQEQGTETNADVQKAREAARQLGLTFKEDIDKTYVSREELDKYIDTKLTERQQVDQVLKEADGLAKKYDGTDGRPRFNKQLVLYHADLMQIPNLEEAYKDLHKDEISSWESSQVRGSRSPGLKTLSGQTGAKQPARVKVTDANLQQLLQEAAEER